MDQDAVNPFFSRQPEKVVVTINGDKRDVDKVYNDIMSRFRHLPYAVDFEITPSETKIILHPWAVND